MISTYVALILLVIISLLWSIDKLHRAKLTEKIEQMEYKAKKLELSIEGILRRQEIDQRGKRLEEKIKESGLTIRERGSFNGYPVHVSDTFITEAGELKYTTEEDYGASLHMIEAYKNGKQKATSDFYVRGSRPATDATISAASGAVCCGSCEKQEKKKRKPKKKK